MPEDRKPKIDLKSRLQRMGGPGAPTPARPMAAPMPTPAPPPYSRSAPPPVQTTQGLPRPPAAPAHAVDPSNPLAALVKSSVAPGHHAAAVAHHGQRIEVDEEAV